MQARTLRSVLGSSLAALWLGACAAVTPYQPLERGEGYAEQKLEANRYRVTFIGSSSTPRQTVEDYILYRAAELTLAGGYDYFVISGAATDRAEQTRPSVGVGFGVGGFSFGSHSSLGFGIGTSTSTDGGAYQGQADVVMFKGRKPDNNPLAFDAHEIQQNLESRIERPAARR